jgi:hypothetical protein
MRVLLSTLGVAAAMLAVSGCCEPQSAQSQYAYQSAVVPLRCTTRPARPAAKATANCAPCTTATLRTEGKTRDLVYDLGCGVIANSNAVTMALGRATPRAFYREGGVGCATAVAQNPSTSTEPAPGLSAVIPGQPVLPEPIPGVVHGALPVPENSELYSSGEFMSECFTLTDEEKQDGPTIYIPGIFSKYDAIPGVTAPIELADTSEVSTPTGSPLASPAESAELTADLPVPVVSDLTRMAGSASTASGPDSSLPEVVLPPKLN